MPVSLRSLDLFTGIGGMSHGLRTIAEPVAYCENEPTRIATLQTLMKKGLLPTVPIHPDVKTFPASEYKGAVDLVMGGWPCRGFSVVGKRNGFEHEQSALFFDFVRIVNEIKPPLIFQENVSCVPIEPIVAALNEYDMFWTVLPAFAVGAPHTRRRWYCLGIRKDVQTIHVQTHPYERHEFARETVPRMCLGKSRPPTLTSRLSMLGNSVVPDAVRFAFMTLATGFRVAPAQLWSLNELEIRRPPPGPHKEPRDRYPTTGACINGLVMKYSLPLPATRPSHNLIFDPSVFVNKKPSRSETHRRLRAPCSRAVWATPRGANTGSSAVLSDRSIRDIYTQLRFERCTPDDVRPGYPNPEWIETTLMGYPPGWTESF